MTSADPATNRTAFLSIVNSLTHTYFEADPVRSTLLGVHDYDSTFGDASPAFHERIMAEMRSYAESLQSRVNPLTLDPDDLLDYRLALSVAQFYAVILNQERPWERNPASYLTQAQWGCFSLLMCECAPIEERSEALLGRLREIPALLHASKQALREPAPVFVQAAVEAVGSVISFLRHSIPTVAGQVPAAAGPLMLAANAAVRACQEYERWLWETAMPMADGDYAIGEYWYQQRLFTEHYLTYSPRDLVRLAQHALAAVHEKLDETGREIDPSVQWREILTRLKRERTPTADLLSAYRTAISEARRFVYEHRLAAAPGDTGVEVMHTPETERATAPYAAYLRPPLFEGSTAGRFWVTPQPSPDPDSTHHAHSVYGVPVTAVHETYPGHHLQSMWAIGNRSAMAKIAASPLLVEGWASYCEGMMCEEGFCADPKVRLLQLMNTVWRACRVIVDVGLHTSEMSMQEAADTLVDVAGLEPIEAVAEVKRTALNPTQPMTYLIGSLLIQDLRDRMKARLRDRFRIGEFHDELLSYGSVPVALISQSMLRKPRAVEEMRDAA